MESTWLRNCTPVCRACSLVAQARAGRARGLTGQETSKMENTDSCSMGDSIGAADSVELFQQRCDVVLGRVRRNAEHSRNLLVRRSLRQQREQFQFSLRGSKTRVRR